MKPPVISLIAATMRKKRWEESNVSRKVFIVGKESLAGLHFIELKEYESGAELS